MYDEYQKFKAVALLILKKGGCELWYTCISSSFVIEEVYMLLAISADVWVDINIFTVALETSPCFSWLSASRSLSSAPRIPTGMTAEKCSSKNIFTDASIKAITKCFNLELFKCNINERY